MSKCEIKERKFFPGSNYCASSGCGVPRKAMRRVQFDMDFVWACRLSFQKVAAEYRLSTSFSTPVSVSEMSPRDKTAERSAAQTLKCLLRG